MNKGPLVIIIAAMISLKAIEFHELAQLNWIFNFFPCFPPSSSRAAGNAIAWWNMLLSMDNMNPCCFGQMELALPQSWELAFLKNPWATKG